MSEQIDRIWIGDHSLIEGVKTIKPSNIGEEFLCKDQLLEVLDRMIVEESYKAQEDVFDYGYNTAIDAVKKLITKDAD